MGKALAMAAQSIPSDTGGGDVTVPGRVFKQICETIIRTYKDSLGWEPEVQIELDEEPGVWCITIELRKMTPDMTAEAKPGNPGIKPVSL